MQGSVVEDVEPGMNREPGYRWWVTYPPDRDMLTVTLVRYWWRERRTQFAVITNDGIEWLDSIDGMSVKPFLELPMRTYASEHSGERIAAEFADKIRAAMSETSEG